MHAADRHDRVAGALLGVHAGDSLGATLEFMEWSAVRDEYPHGLHDIVGGGLFGWPAGAATDDTDLTRAVLLGHLDALRDPVVDPVRAAADHMLDWYEGRWPGRVEGEHPRDVGGATRDGLERYRRSRDPSRAGAGPGRAGNGSLMRCIPTAFARDDAAVRYREAAGISAVTHDDPRCLLACTVYVEMTVALVAGVQAVSVLTVGDAVARRAGQRIERTAPGEEGPATREVRAALADAARVSLPDLVERGPQQAFPQFGGYVLTALTLAVAAVRDPRPFAEVLADVVRLGGDADTNGAIAGGLLGARDGLGAIPQAWLDRLQFRDELLAAARELT
jgi:ADP-ribosylglycohydrolase